MTHNTTFRVRRETTTVRESQFTRDEVLDLLAQTNHGIDPDIRAHHAAQDDNKLADELTHAIANDGPAAAAAMDREEAPRITGGGVETRHDRPAPSKDDQEGRN